MAKKLVSIIIPFLNEKESLSVLFEKIKEQIDILNDYSFELVFIDDGSKDGSLELVKKLYNNFSESYSIKIVAFAKNSGKTNALKTAFDFSNGDYVVTMDADLQDDPKYLGRFIQVLEDRQLDMVVGFRKNRYKTNFIKLISSKSANAVVNFFFKNSVSDMNCGYKIMRKEVTQDLLMKSDYHRFIPVMALAAGYKVGEMEINQYDRVFGESKYGKTGLSRGVKSLFDLITLIFILKFQFNPFHFFGKYGIYLTLIGTLILSYLSVKWMWGFPIQSRPLFFLGILMVMVGINFLGLGLLGELISKNSVATHNLIVKERIGI